MLNRRQMLKGVTSGSGSLLLAPALQAMAAQVEGTYSVPRRVIFVLFDNGFHESGVQPVGVPLQAEQTQDQPLERMRLPSDIEAFTPYKNRLTIVQGLCGQHLAPNHGSGFGALSGAVAGVGQDKFRRAVAESIDAAIARQLPATFPLLVLGIDPGNPRTTTYYASSAWGPGRVIAAQCRPELAYESLFGSTGANRNDFAARRNLLDFVSGDVRSLRTQLAGPEREQLDYHLGALESLSQRENQLANMQSAGTLRDHAPRLPAQPPESFRDTVAAQFDIAAGALMSGLTNVVTLTSGLCRIRGNYTGFSNVGTHQIGHNRPDSRLGVTGGIILSRVRQYIAEQTAGLLRKLQTVREGSGTMLDNTLLVFTSDSANRQHTGGENWPFILLGNLGGRLRTGRLVNYPMRERGTHGDWNYHGTGSDSNPTINALYCTLLHAVGSPREHFNLPQGSRDESSRFGALRELLC